MNEWQEGRKDGQNVEGERKKERRETDGRKETEWCRGGKQQTKEI